MWERLRLSCLVLSKHIPDGDLQDQKYISELSIEELTEDSVQKMIEAEKKTMREENPAVTDEALRERGLHPQQGMEARMFHQNYIKLLITHVLQHMPFLPVSDTQALLPLEGVKEMLGDVLRMVHATEIEQAKSAFERSFCVAVGKCLAQGRESLEVTPEEAGPGYQEECAEGGGRTQEATGKG